MPTGYLLLAFLCAVMLNARNRWLRAVGTLLAAFAVLMIVASTILADYDGTFAATEPNAGRLQTWTPAILNAQALLGSFVAVILMWMAWVQAFRETSPVLALYNGRSEFGRVSRYFHWTIAVLMFCLVPIGLFMSVLPRETPETTAFMHSHQSLGVTVFILVLARISWLLFNPPPLNAEGVTVWERRASKCVHSALYTVLLGFPISGYFLSAAGGAGIDFYGLSLPVFAPSERPSLSIASPVHNVLLPALFYLAIAGHIGAVIKHHFVDRRAHAVRRMLR